MTAFNIAVLPGDGVGPEIMAEAFKVLNAITQKYRHTFSVKDDLVGGAGIDEFGTPLRPQTVQMCRESDAVLMGAVGGPKWDDPTAPTRPEDAILGLRKQLQLFGNLRPVKLFDALLSSSTFKEDVIRGVDLIFVREATGGTYFAEPKKVWTENGKRIGVDTTQYDEDEIARAVKLGFELAQNRRKKLVSADKANVMASSRLWRTVATEVSKDYPDVEFSHMYADACAMLLARRPREFDVIVTDNLFGDVLSDEASMLAGSLGMMPSATLAEGGKFGLYEPIHGSAPDIAGKGVVNPLAMILTSALMLRISLGLETEAAAIESAVEQALARGARTPDIARPGEKTLSTSEMGDAVVANL
ncbi:MAG TPA: 3-isopropylmalate dehydrogenase [Chloroflexota bacterium]|nr:3-isopropylmalate dehydrogenase [Chloroflexota bacterium]